MGTVSEFETCMDTIPVIMVSRVFHGYSQKFRKFRQWLGTSILTSNIHHSFSSSNLLWHLLKFVWSCRHGNMTIQLHLTQIVCMHPFLSLSDCPFHSFMVARKLMGALRPLHPKYDLKYNATRLLQNETCWNSCQCKHTSEDLFNRTMLEHSYCRMTAGMELLELV